MSDFWDMTGAFLLFPLVIVIPGYVIAHFCRILRNEAGTLPWSAGLLLSIAVCPGITYFLMRIEGFDATWFFFGVVWAVFLYLLFLRRAYFRRLLLYPLRHPKSVLLFIGIYLLTAMLVIDFQTDGRLIRPLMSFDFVKHVTVTDTISRTAVPPKNPSFHPGAPIPLFYYYFWFLLCSLIDRLGGSVIGPRGAVLASIVWCGIALFYLVRLYLNAFGRRIVKGIESRHFVYANLLLLVTGLDILPITIEYFTQLRVTDNPDLPAIIWWNDQVASWFASVLWTPHHVGAFIGSMTAFFLIIKDASGPRLNTQTIVLVALALLSTLGMSIWVALVVALFLIVWLFVAWSRGWQSEALFLLVTGSLAFALCVPYILELLHANYLERFPIAFQVRTFYKLDYALTGTHPIILNLARFLILPLNYGLEFGFFAISGLIYWEYRRKMQEKLDRAELFLLTLMATSFFICTFFRSAMANNDLGWRGFMFAQFVLLLLSIPVLSALGNTFSDDRLQLAPSTRHIAKATLVLSTMMIVFQSYVMRLHAMGPDDSLTLSIRHAYEWLDDHLPTDAIVQHNPDEHVEYFHALYGLRQVAVADHLFGRLYGINNAMFDSTYHPLERLFLPDISTAEGLNTVDRFNLDGIFLKYSDPIWDNPASWLAPFTPIYESACCRIYLRNDMTRVPQVTADTSSSLIE